jgi:hypothetical protein
MNNGAGLMTVVEGGDNAGRYQPLPHYQFTSKGHIKDKNQL